MTSLHGKLKEKYRKISREKQFGTKYGPALILQQKMEAKNRLHEALKAAGKPYSWLVIYDVLLFNYYNRTTGECFPSHAAIAMRAGCGISTVQRALKWAGEKGLIRWAHGLVRNSWRVLRTSNRYCFSALLTMAKELISIKPTDGHSERGITTLFSYRRSFTSIAEQARSMFAHLPSPRQLSENT
jgi:Helix-turn-helix domain